MRVTRRRGTGLGGVREGMSCGRLLRRMVAVGVAGGVGSLMLGSVPALAAPISPLVTIKPVGTVTSTTAKVSGTVNPNGSPATTVWNFQYSKDPETEGWTPSASSGVASASEEVSGVLEGLQPDAAYQVRLVAINEEGGEGVSAEPNPKFATPAAAPTIESESVSSINAGGARLEGVVNPNNETSECKFEYGPEPLLAKETTTGLCEPASFPAVFGGQGVGLKVVGLEPDKTYYYRIFASNATGPETGKIEHFTTAFPPETPEAKAASPVEATEVTLHGVLNPASNHESEPGSAEFRYRQSPNECEGGRPGEEQKVAAEPTPPGPLLGHLGEKVEAKIAGLQPGRQYTFCLIA